MRKSLLALIICLAFTSLPASAIKIADTDVAESLTLPNSEETLQLNGAGIRKKFFMKIYIGALYLADKTPDAQAILSDDGPASVVMHILYNKISKEKITGGWDDGLIANLTSADMRAIKPRLDKFNQLFKAVQEGDDIRIDYIPGKGTEVRISGEWRGVVEGNDFFRALLKVWLGSSPVSSSLKNDMLGLD